MPTDRQPWTTWTQAGAAASACSPCQPTCLKGASTNADVREALRSNSLSVASPHAANSSSGSAVPSTMRSTAREGELGVVEEEVLLGVMGICD